MTSVGAGAKAPGEVMATPMTCRDPGWLARWLRGLLWLLLAGHLVSLGADAFERWVLQRALAPGDTTLQALQSLARTSDRLQSSVAIAVLLVLLATYVVAGIWIVRAGRHVRALGAEGLEISPGWGVGWYAIPFANLIKPFHAMRDIWCASNAPANWRSEPVPGLLRVWWGCWLVSNILSQASLRLALAAEDVPAMLGANAVSMVSQLAGVALCLAFLRVVAGINAAQVAQELAGAIPPPRVAAAALSPGPLRP